MSRGKSPVDLVHVDLVFVDLVHVDLVFVDLVHVDLVAVDLVFVAYVGQPYKCIPSFHSARRPQPDRLAAEATNSVMTSLTTPLACTLK